MKIGFKLSGFIATASLLIAACSEAPPPSPTCRITQDFQATYNGPAACLIRVQNTLMVLAHSANGKYDLPKADSLSQEAAQCTAHRATWEQTGFNVEVDKLLGITKNGTHLFSCRLHSGFNAYDGPIDPPDWASPKAEQIVFIDPFDTRNDVWRYPDNLIMYRDGYVAIGFVESTTGLTTEVSESTPTNSPE